jgi:hypothetical protein
MTARRERPASELGRSGQPLCDQDLAAVNGGAGRIAGLSGQDIRRGVATTIGSTESITVGAAQSPGLK